VSGWRARLRPLREACARALDHPIVRKELLESFRRRRYLFLLTGLLLVAAITVMVAMFALSDVGDADPNDVGRQTFAAFFAVELALVMVVFPSFSCTAVVEERTARSLDLLLTTRLTPRSVLLGKLGATLIYGLTFIVATGPLVALTFLWGGVSPAQIGLSYLLLLVVGVVGSTYGLLVSCLANSPARAVARTFLVLPGITLVILGPVAGLAWPFLFDEPPPKWLPTLERRLEGADLLMAALFALLWVWSWVSLFLRLAVNAIQPPRENRSTPLRAWFLGVWGGAVALMVCWLLHHARDLYVSGSSALELLATGQLLTVVVATIAVVVFVVDEPRVSARSRVGGSRLVTWFPSLRPLLRPGAREGARFVLVGVALTWAAVGVCWWLHLQDDTTWSTWRSARELWVWGGAWAAAFLLMLSRAAQLLGRVLTRPLLVRFGVVGMLLALTIYPLLWFKLEPSSAKGSIYKGYWLSPWTVQASLLEQQPVYDRRLVLFAPSGAAIRARVTDLAQALHASQRGMDPAAYAAATKRVHAEQRALELEQKGVGVAAHKASVGFYGGLWLLLLGVDRRLRRRGSAPDSPT
jgi:ABC-type transport system involved in multi-copper enzyme maturation permease subunit